MKVSKLVDPGFSASLETLMKMPGVTPRAMFAIRGIARTIREEASKFEESRRQLVEEHAEKENGIPVMLTPDTVKIKPSKAKELEKKFKELSNIEITLSEIKFSDLGDSPTLTTQDIFNLEFISE